MERALRTDASIPGAILTSPVAIASALLVLTNDLWLKRFHPGIVSGKLSDVGLCVFLPLFIAATLEWAQAALHWAMQRGEPAPSARTDAVSCIVAALYFIAVKTWPWATEAHVAWLSFAVPRWHFRAVTDPSDLLCLPAMGIAWAAMTRRLRA